MNCELCNYEPCKCVERIVKDMKRNKPRPKGCPLRNKKELIKWAMKQFGWSRLQATNTTKTKLYIMWHKLNMMHDKSDRSGLILIKKVGK